MKINDLQEKLDNEKDRLYELKAMLRNKDNDVNWWSFTLGLFIGATVVVLIAIEMGI